MRGHNDIYSNWCKEMRSTMNFSFLVAPYVLGVVEEVNEMLHRLGWSKTASFQGTYRAFCFQRVRICNESQRRKLENVNTSRSCQYACWYPKFCAALELFSYIIDIVKMQEHALAAEGKRRNSILAFLARGCPHVFFSFSATFLEKSSELRQTPSEVGRLPQNVIF